MLRRGFNNSLLIGLVVATAACTVPAIQPDDSKMQDIPAVSGTAEDRRILAGEWEYEDGAVVTLTLDEQGNGTYPWKDGRFETTALSDHSWHGMWYQKENDREGGFAVKFSPDYSDGEGRWWYTRIGEDHSPAQEGGTFHLTRKSAKTAALDKTPVP
ncbi:hypothetical protein [Petrachloros mirabilis]